MEFLDKDGVKTLWSQVKELNANSYPQYNSNKQ